MQRVLFINNKTMDQKVPHGILESIGTFTHLKFAEHHLTLEMIQRVRIC